MNGSASRETKETKVSVQVSLRGQGNCQARTGIGFLDHLLDQLARHGGLDLTVEASGDLHVDAHHTTEDVALTLGQALNEALGDRSGISRFGDAAVPMDEALATVAVDLGGRPYAVLDLGFQNEKLGDLPTQMVNHFLWSLALEASLRRSCSAQRPVSMTTIAPRRCSRRSRWRFAVRSSHAAMVCPAPRAPFSSHLRPTADAFLQVPV